MIDLSSLSVRAIARGVRDRTLSPVEIVRQALSRVEHLDPTIHAWVRTDPSGAVAAAERIERQVLAGEAGPLAGVPIGVKDNFDVAGLPTTAGFRPFASRIAAQDAASVARLRAAGAIVLGKTVTTQFAFIDPPPTRNPWSPSRTPGGSSSGSAAAVATGMVPAALGSQTAGSILRPAAYCGVVGLKPTYGQVSTAGVLPDAWSLDHVGVIAGSVDDAALLLHALTDQTGPDQPAARDRVDAGDCSQPIERPRLGILVDFLDRASTDVREHLLGVARRYEAAGARVQEVSLPIDFDVVLATQRIIMQVEMAAVHRSLLGQHPDEYLPHIRTYVEVGSMIPGDVYVHAQRLRRRFAAALPAVFAGVDGLICPTAAGVAPDPSTTGDSSFQAIWTLAGVPALTVPTGLNAAGLPFATQLVTSALGDNRLLALGRWLETIVGPMQRPPLPSAT